MILSIDFDGTIVENKYPDLGDLLPNSKKVINYLHSRGHTIIINTCRTSHYVENAKAYLTQKGIHFDLCNENSPKMIEKYGNNTRKISCDAFIDDLNISDIVLRKRLGTEAYNEEVWKMHLEEFQFIEKPCIICLVGESGAGKSLAAEYLESMYDINLIQSYTDRDKRYPSESGHTFLSQLEFDRIMEDGELLCCTEYGEESKRKDRYFCLTEDLSHMNLYVITEDGFEELRDRWKNHYDIYSIRIHRPLYDRVCDVGEDRVKRDEGRFSLLDSEFDYIINNDVNEKEYLYKQLDLFLSTTRLAGRAKPYDLFIAD